MKKKEITKSSQFKTKEIKKNNNMNEDYQKVLTFFVVLAIIAVLIGLLFYFNGRFVTKDHFQEEEKTTTTEVKFNTALLTVDTMFNVSKKDYMVLLYDPTATGGFLYSGLANNYDDEKKMPLYSVDMKDAMNRKYYNKDGKENTKPKKPADVMITRPTLIVFKKGVVSSYITDTDIIVEKLS